MKEVARQKEARICAVMDEIEYTKGTSDGGNFNENGFEVSLGKCPEDIAASERREDDREAEAADSEIILRQPNERPDYEP